MNAFAAFGLCYLAAVYIGTIILLVVKMFSLVQSYTTPIWKQVLAWACGTTALSMFLFGLLLLHALFGGAL